MGVLALLSGRMVGTHLPAHTPPPRLGALCGVSDRVSDSVLPGLPRSEVPLRPRAGDASALRLLGLGTPEGVGAPARAGQNKQSAPFRIKSLFPALTPAACPSVGRRVRPGSTAAKSSELCSHASCRN